MAVIRHEARGTAREPDGGTPGHTIEHDISAVQLTKNFSGREELAKLECQPHRPMELGLTSICLMGIHNVNAGPSHLYCI